MTDLWLGYFCAEVSQAIYGSGLLDQFIEDGRLNSVRPHHFLQLKSFWQSYLVEKIVLLRYPPRIQWLSMGLKTMRQAIEALCDATGDKNHNKIRRYTKEVISKASFFHSFGCFVDQNAEKNLLKVAIINQCPDVVRSILQSTKMKYTEELAHIYDDILPDPLWLAGESGNLEIIKMITSSNFGDPRNMRMICLAGAISRADLRAVEFMTTPGTWHNRPNVRYILGESWLMAEIPFGIVRSKHRGFYRRLAENLSTFQYSTAMSRNMKEPGINDILYRVVASPAERLEIAVELMRQGASLKDRLSESSIAIQDAVRTIRHDHHPYVPTSFASCEEQGFLGNGDPPKQRFLDKVVDRYTNPKASAPEALYHALKLGRTDKVHKLLETGQGDVNTFIPAAICHPHHGFVTADSCLNSKEALVSYLSHQEYKGYGCDPVAIAVMLEDESMCRYLVSNGADPKAWNTNNTLLIMCALAGLESMGRLLVNYGASMEEAWGFARWTLISLHNDKKDRALQIAQYLSEVYMFKLLLESKNTSDAGNTESRTGIHLIHARFRIREAYELFVWTINVDKGTELKHLSHTLEGYCNSLGATAL